MLVSDFFRRSTFFRPWWQGSRSRRQRRLHAGPTESAPEIVKFFSQLLIILGGKNELFSNQQLTFFPPDTVVQRAAGQNFSMVTTPSGGCVSGIAGTDEWDRRTSWQSAPGKTDRHALFNIHFLIALLLVLAVVCVCVCCFGPFFFGGVFGVWIW